MNHPVKTTSLLEIAEHVRATVIGDGTIQVAGVSSIASAGSGDLVFVEDEKNLGLALKSRAAWLIAGDFAAGNTASKPLLLASQPRLAFARAAPPLAPSVFWVAR